MLKTAFVSSMIIAAALTAASTAQAQSSGPVYELRIYTAAPGKFDAVVARIRDHAIKLFQKHGMEAVGFWVAADPPWNPKSKRPAPPPHSPMWTTSLLASVT